MDLVPFRPEHLAAIDPPAMTPEQLSFFCRHYRECGPAWSGIDAGRVVGCGGVIVAGDIGQGWAVLSQPVPAAAVHRAALRALRQVDATAAVRRIDASALVVWPAACRWLERLGFSLDRIEGEYGRYVKWVPTRCPRSSG